MSCGRGFGRGFAGRGVGGMPVLGTGKGAVCPVAGGSVVPAAGRCGAGGGFASPKGNSFHCKQRFPYALSFVVGGGGVRRDSAL